MAEGESVEPSKNCSKCKANLPIAFYYAKKDGKYGRATVCKPCVRKYCNLAETKRRNRISNNKRYHRDPGKHRALRLKSRYGLTPADLDLLLIAQGGICPICIDPLGPIYYIDHDHKTKKVRGLLHNKCNLLLGHADDSPATLGLARMYLLRGGIQLRYLSRG